MGKQFVVVEWRRPNGQQLEEVEITKLVVDGGKPEVGSKVKMQFQGEIWQGQILSFHESLRSAKAAVDKDLEESFVNKEGGIGSRKRLKNKRLEGYETNHDADNEMNETLSKKQKPSGKGQKDKGAKESHKESAKAKKKRNQSTSERCKDAAEKERRQHEREKANQEKEKERRALAERNNKLLEEMTALVSRSEDSFMSDVVSECADDFLQGNTLMDTSPMTPPTMHVSCTTSRPAPTMHNTCTTPRLPTMNNTSTTPRLPTIHNTSTTPRLPTSTNTRPTVGVKCPRRNLSLSPPGHCYDEVVETCVSCARLKETIRELEDKIKQCLGQGSNDPPRPGKVNPLLAERFKMVELIPGTQVYVYQTHIQQASCKPSFKSAASFLLNCFYTNDELQGMNLSGANGKAHPGKDIIESIIGFVIKTFSKSCPSASAIKIALRNKLSALQSRNSKKYE